MQNSSMRVRGSFGLKFASELSEKGSALIETDSSATARVDVAETLNKTGDCCGAAEALPLVRNTVRAKLAIAANLLDQPLAQFLIGVRSLYVAHLVNKLRRTNFLKTGGGATGLLHPGSNDYTKRVGAGSTLFRRGELRFG